MNQTTRISKRFNSNIKTVDGSKKTYTLSNRSHGKKPQTNLLHRKSETKRRNSDEGRYKGLVSKLQESSWLGKDEYPTTVAGMYALLTRHSGQIGNRAKD